MNPKTDLTYQSDSFLVERLLTQSVSYHSYVNQIMHYFPVLRVRVRGEELFYYRIYKQLIFAKGFILNVHFIIEGYKWYRIK